MAPLQSPASSSGYNSGTLYGGIEASKITKACSRCRRLKVRCERSDPNDPHSPCKRCVKGNRECKIDVSRRRRHPAPSVSSSPLVTETAPIDTRPLHETTTIPTQRHQGVNQIPQPQPQIHPSRAPSREYSFARPSVSTNVVAVREQMMSTWKALMERDADRLSHIENMPYQRVTKPADSAIAQGILSREEATRRLSVYREYIFPRFPIVPLANASVDDIINQTPVLFHCVMDVVSLTSRDAESKEVNMQLHNMAYNTVIHEVLITSTKSIELLQSLILLTFWYNESEFYHRQRMCSLGALAESLAYDLGIGGTQPPGGSNAPIFEQIVTPQATVNASSPQCRLAWLAVYVMKFQVISANRRPVSRLFNNYTLDSIATFTYDASDPRAYHLALMAEIVHLQEQVTLQLFKQQNESSVPDMFDPAVQYLMHQFDNEIDMLESRAKPSGCNRMAFLVLRVYLHQAVLYSPYDNSKGRTPFTNFSLRVKGPLTFQGAKSFGKCFMSAMDVLDMTIALDLDYLPIMTMPMWGMIVFCCAIVMKCRAICIFNRNYAEACFVSEEQLDKVTDVIEKFNRVISEFPSTNNALSCNFLLKLLVCHHDARTHFWAAEEGLFSGDELGDPIFVQKVRTGGISLGSDASAASSTVSPQLMESGAPNGIDGGHTGPPEGRIPGTENGAPNVISNGFSNGLSHGIPSGVGTNGTLDGSGLGVPGTSIPRARQKSVEKLPPTPLERELQDRRISVAMSEEYPLWQLSDDFWRDIIPNEGTFNFDF